MSIYKKTDTGAARLDNPTSLSWIKLAELAGNHYTSKTFTVIDTSVYHEILLTCGTAIENYTWRILSSSVIPITRWLACSEDSNSGSFQAAYSGTTYQAGLSRISNTSIKLYANTKTLTSVFIR